MLFGGNRLGPRLWLFSIFMVVFGAHFSALWIVMANSWMQTPPGTRSQRPGTGPRGDDELLGGRLHAVVHPRIMHVFMASWTVGAALMLSVSSWYLLKKRHIELAKSNLKVALPLFILFAIAQRLHLRRQQGGRGDAEPAAQARLDGGALPERVVCPDVPRGLGRRDHADDDRDLDPVPPELPCVPGHPRHGRRASTRSRLPRPRPSTSCSRSITT